MKLGSKSKRVDNEAKIEVIDTSRKRFLSTAFSALAAIPLSRARNNLDGAAELMSGKQRPVRKLYPLPFGAPSREKFFELCSACQLCEERCELSALRLRPEYSSPLPAREGDTHKRFPMRAHIDSALCSGCGACENGCPATPFKAIVVEGIE